MEEYQSREYLSKLDPHKSMGHDGRHRQVLRELTDVIVRILLIIFGDIFDYIWVIMVTERCLRIGGNQMSLFKKDRKDNTGNYRPDSLTLNLGK